MDCLSYPSFSRLRARARAKSKLSVQLKTPTPSSPASPPSAFFDLLHYDIRKLIYEQLLALTSKSTMHISSCYLSGHQKLVAVPCFGICTRCHKPPHRGDCYQELEESPNVPESHYRDFAHSCLFRMQWERGNEPRNVLGIWGALLSCRQMHSEIMSLIYANFSFGITYLHTLNRFVNISSPLTLNNIQHLQLKWDMSIYIWPDRGNARVDTMLFPNRTFLRKCRLSPGDVILEVKQPLALQQWEVAWRKIARMAALRTVEVMLSWEDHYAHDAKITITERKIFEALLGIGQEGNCETNESWADGTVVSVEKGMVTGWMYIWPSSIFKFSREPVLSRSDPTLTNIKQYYERWYSTEHNSNNSRISLSL